MTHSRFPRVGRLRRGYQCRQVERYLDRIELALRGGLPPISAAEIRHVGFELVHHGYDASAVDAALDAIEARTVALDGAGSGRRGRVDLDREAQALRSELDGPYMRRFPRAGTLHRGYEPDDVDEFVDRVVEVLAGRGALRPDEVRDVGFRPRRGGYDEDAVDDALDRLVELLLIRERAQPAPPAAGTARTPATTPQPSPSAAADDPVVPPPS